MLRILSTIVIILTFLSYLAPFVKPDWLPILVHFGTLFPWLLMANILLLIIFAYRKHRFALYHLAFLFLGWNHITSFLGLNFSSNPHVAAPTIKIASHNIGEILYKKKNMSQFAIVIEDYLEFLQEIGDPDIVCLQETSFTAKNLLQSKSKYIHHFSQNKGTIIFSKYEIKGGGEIPFPSSGNSSLWADVSFQGKTLRVYDIHLQSNRISSKADSLIDSGELDDEKTWKEAFKVLSTVGQATKVRASQAQLVADHTKESPYPVIICGDFNDTPNSYVYRTLSTGLQDCFKETGLGIGTTFAGSIPLLRIDYILADKQYKVNDCKIIHKKWSDHYPVVVELQY